MKKLKNMVQSRGDVPGGELEHWGHDTAVGRVWCGETFPRATFPPRRTIY